MSIATSSTSWEQQAACKGMEPDALFVQGAAQNRAKAVCFSCPVRTDCLADALDHRIEFGVWGGMTERERRALLRKRPNVQSWRRLLTSAQDDKGAISLLGESRKPRHFSRSDMMFDGS